MKTPAITADPITPATFGPIAWGRRNVRGFDCWPMWCEMRAAIGTADTPADPISGLIFSFRKRFMVLANSRPAHGSRREGDEAEAENQQSVQLEDPLG